MGNERPQQSRRDQMAYGMGFEYAFWHGRFDAVDTSQRRQGSPEPPPPPKPTPTPKKALWHEVLGVAPDASYETIRTAYRSLAARLHPDKGGVQLLFIQIQEAWEEAQKQRSK